MVGEIVGVTGMMDKRRQLQAARLKQAREKCGFKSARSAALRFHWVYLTYTKHETGTRAISRAVGKYARAFGVDEAWLLGLKEEEADEPTDTLGYLRHLDAKLDRVLFEIGEMKSSMAGMLQILASHDARLLRVDERLDRIEKLLGLVDPAVPRK